MICDLCKVETKSLFHNEKIIKVFIHNNIVCENCNNLGNKHVHKYSLGFPIYSNISRYQSDIFDWLDMTNYKSHSHDVVAMKKHKGTNNFCNKTYKSSLRSANYYKNKLKNNYLKYGKGYDIYKKHETNTAVSYLFNEILMTVIRSKKLMNKNNELERKYPSLKKTA